MYEIGETPDTPCQEWTRGQNGKGYGDEWIPHLKKSIGAHRAAYAREYGWGTIEGMVVEHACDNPLCVRVDHLRLGTYATNMYDRNAKGRHPNSVKTRCKRGHPFTEENTYMEGHKRHCRKCRALYQRDLRASRRGVKGGG